MHEKAKRSGKFVKQKQKIEKGKTWHFQTRGLLKLRKFCWFNTLLWTLPKKQYGFKTPWITDLCRCLLLLEDKSLWLSYPYYSFIVLFRKIQCSCQSRSYFPFCFTKSLTFCFHKTQRVLRGRFSFRQGILINLHPFYEPSKNGS